MISTLTPRERVLLALNHQQTDRMPISMICSFINSPAVEEWDAYLRRERGIGAVEYLAQAVDIQPVGPRYIGPALPAGVDYWGVQRAPVPFGRSSYDEITHYPLAGVTTIGDLDAHCWPTPAWFDYSVIPAQIASWHAQGNYATWLCQACNPFESSWYMFGFERIFTAMFEEPDLVHALLRRVTDFMEAHLRCALEAAGGELDLVFTADDIAGQQGLLMSLGMWEEFIKPCHQRLNALIHEFGTRVIYHSDGAVTEAVPALIDMGIDVLQALQFDAAGMDPAYLKTRFGDQLCFAGGVSVQHTLPFGTPEDVRDEVRRLRAILGRHGGYLLGPSHAIQADTRPENITALFDTALEPLQAAWGNDTLPPGNPPREAMHDDV